jgi:hypothetical protein
MWRAFFYDSSLVLTAMWLFHFKNEWGPTFLSNLYTNSCDTNWSLSIYYSLFRWKGIFQSLIYYLISFLLTIVNTLDHFQDKNQTIQNKLLLFISKIDIRSSVQTKQTWHMCMLSIGNSMKRRIFFTIRNQCSEYSFYLT